MRNEMRLVIQLKIVLAFSSNKLLLTGSLFNIENFPCLFIFLATFHLPIPSLEAMESVNNAFWQFFGIIPPMPFKYK